MRNEAGVSLTPASRPSWLSDVRCGRSELHVHRRVLFRRRGDRLTQRLLDRTALLDLDDLVGRRRTARGARHVDLYRRVNPEGHELSEHVEKAVLGLHLRHAVRASRRRLYDRRGNQTIDEAIRPLDRDDVAGFGTPRLNYRVIASGESECRDDGGDATDTHRVHS